MIKLTPEKPPYYEQGTQIKQYQVLMTQVGTAAPTVTIINNTMGTIVWTRNGAGEYKGTLAGAFPIGKHAGWVGNNTGALNTYQIDNNQGNENEIWLYTEADGTLADDLLTETLITIITKTT